MGCLYRCKQFYMAYTAKIYDNDRDFLSKYLTNDQLQIFYQLPLYEIKHSLDVAYSIIKIFPEAPKDLIIAGLMHDIGKGNKLTPIKKAIAVIIDRIMPFLIPVLSKRYTFLKTYYDHNIIGAEIAKKIGLTDLTVYLIEHHNEKKPKCKYLQILKEADDRN